MAVVEAQTLPVALIAFYVESAMKVSCVFLAIALAKICCAKCPMGTVQGVNGEDCYYFDASPTMWLQVSDR